MKIFYNKLVSFFLCLLQGKCKYSIKKFFAFVFLLLVIILSIFTNKIEIIAYFLFMITALLAIRSFDKMSFRTHLGTSQINDLSKDDNLYSTEKTNQNNTEKEPENY